MAESGVVIKINIVGAEPKLLEAIPPTYSDLVSLIASGNPGMSGASIQWKGTKLNDTKDLITAYLNCRDEEFVFDVEIEEKVMSYMDTAVQSQYSDMVSKFKQMMSTPEESKTADVVCPMENGQLTKEGLLMVVKSMAAEAREKVLENSKKFMAKRQEFYKVDEEKYQETIMQQLQFNDMLIMSITSQTCQRFNVSPQQFDQAAQMYQADPDVRHALESLAVESIQSSGSIPESLTRDMLKQVLNSSCDFIEGYMTAKPQMHPMEVIMLKMREADEIHQTYGYDELAIAAAISHFQIDTSPDFAELRERLGEVTQKLFSMGPGGMGGPGGPPGMGGPGGMMPGAPPF